MSAKPKTAYPTPHKGLKLLASHLGAATAPGGRRYACDGQFSIPEPPTALPDT